MITQLKNDITELFTNDEVLNQYYTILINTINTEDNKDITNQTELPLATEDSEDGTNPFANTLVKEAYDMIPEIRYPLITIEEIDNTNDNRFWDGQEYSTDLAYQFTISCEQSGVRTANENVRLMQTILDKYLQSERYNCFRRIGYTAPRPSLDDPNVKVGILRYDCSLVANTHTIYRRY